MRRVFLALAVFAVLLSLLFGLLFAAACIPNTLLASRFTDSALTYSQTDAYAIPENGRLSGIIDNYADSILLNVSWQMGKGAPLSAVLDTDYYNGDELGLNAGLYLAVTEDAEPNTDYSRYWHGTAMFVRFLHLFTDVTGIRWIGFSLILLTALLTLAMLLRRRHGDLALFLLLSLLTVQIWNLRLSVEFQPSFLLTFLFCPLFLVHEAKNDFRLVLLAVAGGTAAAFFDFLTTETTTILLPLLLVTAVRAKEGRLGSVRKNLLLYLQCGLCWNGSYAGTFLVKWTAASLATGENAFIQALSSVGERIGGAVELGESSPTSFFSAITANLTVLFGGTSRLDPARVFLGTAIVLGILFSVWYLFRKPDGERNGALLLLLLGAMVFLRYLLLNNHSYLHAFFTYRALLCPIFALLAALRLHIALPQRKKGKR